MQNQIPKIIHFFHDYDVKIWQKDKKPQFRMCYMSWLLKCPNYKIIHWHDKSLEFKQMLKSSEFLRKCYKLKLWAFVSDYVRAYALYNYGGIYLDTDVQLLKNFDEFLNDKFFVSQEGAILKGRSLVEPAVIGSIPQHKVVKKILDIYNNEDINKFDDFMAPYVYSEAIKEFTGFDKIKFNDDRPNYLNCTDEDILYLKNLDDYKNTKVLKFEDNQIKIYPSEYFCPTWHVFKDMSITENTVAIHWNQSSWWGTPEDDKKMCLLKSNKINKIFDYKVNDDKYKINIMGIKITLSNNKKYKKHKFLYENKKFNLFTHQYNCGQKEGLTERSIELSIADYWLKNNKCDYEIGAVSPYYWKKRPINIIDPSDTHPDVTKSSLFDINLSGKNVLSISTIEHIGTGEYGVTEVKYNAIDALNKILNESNKCLITFPVGANQNLDEYFVANYDKLKNNYKVNIYHREKYINNWNTIDINRIFDEENRYGIYSANAVVFIEK